MEQGHPATVSGVGPEGTGEPGFSVMLSNVQGKREEAEGGDCKNREPALTHTPNT